MAPILLLLLKYLFLFVHNKSLPFGSLKWHPLIVSQLCCSGSQSRQPASLFSILKTKVRVLTGHSHYLEDLGRESLPASFRLLAELWFLAAVEPRCLFPSWLSMGTQLPDLPVFLIHLQAGNRAWNLSWARNLSDFPAWHQWGKGVRLKPHGITMCPLG